MPQEWPQKEKKNHHHPSVTYCKLVTKLVCNSNRTNSLKYKNIKYQKCTISKYKNINRNLLLNYVLLILKLFELKILIHKRKNTFTKMRNERRDITTDLTKLKL